MNETDLIGTPFPLLNFSDLIWSDGVCLFHVSFWFFLPINKNKFISFSPAVMDHASPFLTGLWCSTCFLCQETVVVTLCSVFALSSVKIMPLIKSVVPCVATCLTGWGSISRFFCVCVNDCVWILLFILSGSAVCAFSTRIYLHDTDFELSLNMIVQRVKMYTYPFFNVRHGLIDHHLCGVAVAVVVALMATFIVCVSVPGIYNRCLSIIASLPYNTVARHTQRTQMKKGMDGNKTLNPKHNRDMGENWFV